MAEKGVTGRRRRAGRGSAAGFASCCGRRQARGGADSRATHRAMHHAPVVPIPCRCHLPQNVPSGRLGLSGRCAPRFGAGPRQRPRSSSRPEASTAPQAPLVPGTRVSILAGPNRRWLLESIGGRPEAAGGGGDLGDADAEGQLATSNDPGDDQSDHGQAKEKNGHLENPHPTAHPVPPPPPGYEGQQLQDHRGGNSRPHESRSQADGSCQAQHHVRVPWAGIEGNQLPQVSHQLSWLVFSGKRMVSTATASFASRRSGSGEPASQSWLETG